LFYNPSSAEIITEFSGDRITVNITSKIPLLNNVFKVALIKISIGFSIEAESFVKPLRNHARNLNNAVAEKPNQTNFN
jgi:hypothetical protein